MKAYERLMNLEHHRIEVFRVNNQIAVTYSGSDISDGAVRKGMFGVGATFEDACEDYLNKISGQKLIFGFGENREEVTVL